jgi:hypothetical protein
MTQQYRCLKQEKISPRQIFADGIDKKSSSKKVIEKKIRLPEKENGNTAPVL